MRGKRLFVSILRNALAWILSVIMLVPIALVVVNSFKTQGEASTMTFSLPKKLMFENYSMVISRGNLVEAFFNSMLYSVVSVGLIVILSSMAAYVLSRRRTKLSNALYIYIVLGLTLTLNHIALIKIMETIGLLGTRGGMIILYTALQIPFAVFLLYSFICGVPRELDEAGIIDGCGALVLFYRVIFPILKPAVVSVAILNFLNTWNEFTLPLYYLNDSSKWPMTNTIYSFYGQFSSSWNLVCADIVMTSLPVIIIYLLGQKFIVGGLTAGAVKG